MWALTLTLTLTLALTLRCGPPNPNPNPNPNPSPNPHQVRFFGIRRALRPHDESEVHPEAKARSIEPGAWEQLVADFTEPAKGGKGGGPAPVGRRG